MTAAAACGCPSSSPEPASRPAPTAEAPGLQLTAAPDTPTTAGKPILLVTSADNPFNGYLAEILRNEGLNAFDTLDVAALDAAALRVADVVVLGEMPLRAAQVRVVSDWVNAGGRLVAMRPDKKLASLLGLVDTGGTLAEAYLRVETSSGPGHGIVGETIQFHGTADLYTLHDAKAVATLYSGATSPANAPAVTLRSVGRGRAAAFTYDLARSVVYTRQGNPAWRRQRRDQLLLPPESPRRLASHNLFYGESPSDPQPSWIDVDKVAIPQADEQQRLLANLIILMNLDRKPLPRFWYLPSGLKAAVMMTGDDHGKGGTLGRWERLLAASPEGCSVPDWQCVRATSYIMPGRRFDVAALLKGYWGSLTDREAAHYERLGFEVSVHVNNACVDFTSYDDLDSAYRRDLAAFASRYPSVRAPTTHRIHCVVWSDYDTHPKVEAAHGIRLDTNYYWYPAKLVMDRPGLFTGSAMPMRFADRDGHLVDVYQAPTQMTDESEQSYPATVDTLLDNALGPRAFYGVFTANMHTDTVESASSDAIVTSARSRGVPVVTARQVLEWLDGRNGSAFHSVSWQDDTLSFEITTASGARNLRAMLPARRGSHTLHELRRNGSAVAYELQTIKGIEYAVFPASDGPHAATYR